MQRVARGKASARLSWEHWERRLACHEAAHAVICYKLRLPFYSVSIEHNGLGSGCVTLQEMALDKPSRVKHFIMACWAGKLAEAIDSGEKPDDQDLRRYWKDDGENTPMDLSDDRNEKQLDDPSNIIAHATRVCDGERAQAFIDYLKHETTALIRNGSTWAAIQALSDALLEKRTLSAKKARRIIRRAESKFLKTCREKARAAARHFLDRPRVSEVIKASFEKLSTLELDEDPTQELNAPLLLADLLVDQLKPLLTESLCQYLDQSVIACDQIAYYALRSALTATLINTLVEPSDEDNYSDYEILDILRTYQYKPALVAHKLGEDSLVLLQDIERELFGTWALGFSPTNIESTTPSTEADETLESLSPAA